MKKINVGLCSYGMSGKVFHAPFLQAHPGFTLQAVWERSSKKVQAEFPDVASYQTFEELLQDPTLDLIIVNTPNYTHFDLAYGALQANKHVIVEKPLTVSSVEAQTLMNLAEERGLVLSVFHNRRYDSDFKSVQQIVSEGRLGEIVEAEFHFDRFKEALSPKVHKETAGPGTGALYDLGAHLIDQALYLFGMPAAVFADIRIIRPLSQVDDYFEVLLYYQELRVRLHCSYLVKEPIPAYTLHGFRGTFLKQRTDVQEKELQEGKQPTISDWGKEEVGVEGKLHIHEKGRSVQEDIPSPAGNYMTYFDGIYASVVTGKPVPVSAQEGRQVIQVIEASFESNRTKRIIEL